MQAYRSLLRQRTCARAPVPMSARVCVRPARRRVVASYAEEPISATTNEDFYGILGIDPNASSREVRKAYIDLMRDFHPDQHSGDGPEVAAANELCALLNEIYETLSDADQRSTYDALVGFAVGGVNPFEDTAHERDQVFVDETSCIGCAMCVRTCPSAFHLEPQYARARAVNHASTDAEHELVGIAIETCPVDCISYVTLPQLSLLETALSSMRRVDVSVMRRSGAGGGPSVFDSASLAWRRRQAAIAAKKRAAEIDWQWWEMASGKVDLNVGDIGKGPRAGGPGTGGAQSPPPNGADSRRIARLAAVAARASRIWRSAGGSRQRSAVALLE